MGKNLKELKNHAQLGGIASDQLLTFACVHFGALTPPAGAMGMPGHALGPFDPLVPKNWKCSNFIEIMYITQFLGVEFNGNTYFCQKTFLDPQNIVFQILGSKVHKTRLFCKIHISHVTKLVWVPINFYHEDVLQV